MATVHHGHPHGDPHDDDSLLDDDLIEADDGECKSCFDTALCT
jgi:hypothetical protein